MSEVEQELLKFPCRFPIKAVGLADETFETAVLTIIRLHATNLKEDAIRTRLSKNGKYMAITIIIEATSKEQLDAIYTDLNNHELVLMTL